MEIKNKKPDIRYLNEMKKVLYDKKWVKEVPNFEVYYMYRGIKKKGGLRYDVTLLPPKMLGKEFVKTKGHEHSGNYGELYIVLKGQALYLIQKYKNQKIKDVYIVRAKRGEAVIIPPGYGHITINPSKKEELIEANWLAQKCQNIYKLFEKKQGACYYYIKSGSRVLAKGGEEDLSSSTSRALAKGGEEDLSSSTWIKNKTYGKIPKLHFKKPLKKIPKNLDFLKG